MFHKNPKPMATPRRNNQDKLNILRKQADFFLHCGTPMEQKEEEKQKRRLAKNPFQKRQAVAYFPPQHAQAPVNLAGQ